MVRTAVFGPMPGNWSHSLIRFAGAKGNGKAVTCALMSRFGHTSYTSGRRWTESEFCINPQSGLLQMFSEAPGIYATYDYTNALSYHGRTLPREITILQGGNTVLQIHISSLDDADAGDGRLFTPTAEILARGPRPILSRHAIPTWLTCPPDTPADRNMSLSMRPSATMARWKRQRRCRTPIRVSAQAALAHVRRSNYPANNPGNRPLEQEAFINVRFTPAH